MNEDNSEKDSVKNDLKSSNTNNIKVAIWMENEPNPMIDLKISKKTKSKDTIGGYDVFLSCSSSNELDWVTQNAVPQLE